MFMADSMPPVRTLKITKPESELDAEEVELNEGGMTLAAVYVPPCEFWNYSDNAIRVRAQYHGSSGWVQEVFNIQSGGFLNVDGGWRLIHAHVADNHYAEISITSQTDGLRRVYAIRGPYNVTDDSKSRIVLREYRYSASTSKGTVTQIG
jgi:hypothetical protein